VILYNRDLLRTQTGFFEWTPLGTYSVSSGFLDRIRGAWKGERRKQDEGRDGIDMHSQIKDKSVLITIFYSVWSVPCCFKREINDSDHASPGVCDRIRRSREQRNDINYTAEFLSASWRLMEATRPAAAGPHSLALQTAVRRPKKNPTVASRYKRKRPFSTKRSCIILSS